MWKQAELVSQSWEDATLPALEMEGTGPLGQKTKCSAASGGSTALLRAWPGEGPLQAKRPLSSFWPSDLHSCKVINFYFKPPNLW